MVNPVIMCDRHLLGEHCELHMILGSAKEGIALDGYVENNLLEISSLQSRHEALAKEMVRRKMNHNSELSYPDGYTFGQGIFVSKGKVDREEALKELLRRCPECKKNYEMEGG